MFHLRKEDRKGTERYVWIVVEWDELLFKGRKMDGGK